MKKKYIIHDSDDMGVVQAEFVATEEHAAEIFSQFWANDDCSCFCVTDRCDVTTYFLNM